jgi:hypothetical protein
MVLQVLDLKHLGLRLAGMAIRDGKRACFNLVLADVNAHDLGGGIESPKVGFGLGDFGATIAATGERNSEVSHCDYDALGKKKIGVTMAILSSRSNPDKPKLPNRLVRKTISAER